ncbi:Phosphate transport system permease protein PstC [Polystyrenella longa]|uniref:Phosphate transport system permease protein n=1 Tax=Polystyrenella longa TaxID=2528007 RepID=A0A518CHL1_9PLAN|nr:Phosphate transport system permease protein PstC [Polystyrenella longa]
MPVNQPEPKGVSTSLDKRFSVQRLKEQLIRFVLMFCALLSIATTISIIYVLITESLFSFGESEAFFQQVSFKDFFTDTKWTPQYADQHFGILPLLAGTFLIAGIAALVGIPLGLASAIYMSEYASPRIRNFIKPILEILAGIPTVVYGYFALVFVTPYILRPFFQDLLGFDVSVFNAASAGIVVGIMIIPMISSLSEDALRAVPQSLREAGYALGSTKFDVSIKVVLPAAISGIAASFILAFSRAVGETMAVTIAAGQQPNLTFNPFESVETMTAFIVNISMGDTPVGSIEYKSLYAVALTLFLVTLTMNFISYAIMRRFREVYQ